jgi:hypothetical protein
VYAELASQEGKLVNALVRFGRPSRAWVTLLTLAIVAAPLPCLAGETSSTAAKPTPSIRTSVAKIVHSETLATARPAVRAQDAGTTDLSSKSFFRSPAGIATLLALAAGVGYALYSTNHDRVKSPAR